MEEEAGFHQKCTTDQHNWTSASNNWQQLRQLAAAAGDYQNVICYFSSIQSVNENGGP